MKKVLLAFLLLAAVAAGLVLAYRQMSQERALEAEAEKPVAAESRVHRTSDGEAVVSLEPPAQQRLGLQLALPAPGRLPREVPAFGRVLDPAPLAELAAELARADIAVAASAKELQRVKQLHEQGQNASLRALEAAEATARRDQLARESVELKLVAGWGQALARRPDLPELVRALARQESALVRLDLPAGATSAPPVGARLWALEATARPMAAELLGPAPDVDPQTQGQGFLCLVKNAAGRLRPGQALSGRLQQPGEPLAGVLVPLAAVVRAQGRAWVYVESQETNFIRRPVALDHPAPEGWLVTAGLRAQDRLVVRGAQTLFSEEMKDRIQVGD